MKLSNKIFPLVFVFLIVISCSKESLFQHLDKDKSNKEQLPTIVNNQLEAVRKNLNKYMGQSLKLVDYKIISRPNKIDLNTTLDLIANPNSIVAYGNIVVPNTVKIGPMHTLVPSRIEEGISIMKEHASKTIQEDDLSMELTWVFKEKEIKTIAFYNEEGISWDNLMIGLIMMDTKPTKIENVDDNTKSATMTTSKEGRWDGAWIWGSRRGSMYYRLTITHDGTTVFNTTISDGAWMTIGTATSHSIVTKRTGAFGEGKYALGMATPIASLIFDAAAFKVSVSGIGSNIVQNGTADLFPQTPSSSISIN